MTLINNKNSKVKLNLKLFLFLFYKIFYYILKIKTSSEFTFDSWLSLPPPIAVRNLFFISMKLENDLSTSAVCNHKELNKCEKQFLH